MNICQQIAEHLRQVHFGGNWTSVNLRDQLAGVSWRQATRQVGGFHSIATLVFHMNYYIAATRQVLDGGPLDARDKLSFDLPRIAGGEDWEKLKDKSRSDVEHLASAIETMPESQLWVSFVDQKYGNYYRCLVGPIEHCHYHLGQIAMIKSLLAGG